MIYFFYGEDSFTVRQEAARMRDKFVEKHSLSGVFEVSLGPDIDDLKILGILREAFFSQGLFVSEKLVILRNFLGEIDKFPNAEEFLIENLEKLPRGTLALFVQDEALDKRLKFFKRLQKIAQTREFPIPRGGALAAWIKNYFTAGGFEIQHDALVELAKRMGDSEENALFDMWQVRQELEKLMLYCTETKIIRELDVQEVVSVNIGQNVFSLTNAAAEGRVGEAVLFLEQMAGRSQAADMKSQSLKIIGALAAQLRSLLLVKSVESKEPVEAARALGWREGRVWINAKLAKKFSKDKLAGLLADLKAIDLRLKTSEEPPKLLLALFLQKMKG